jgi:hypothetical protein
MHIRFKLALFFVAGTCAVGLFYVRFGQNIKSNGLLNFIGIPTIIVVVICHAIAFLIRFLLVRRHCRSAGISRGKRAWLFDLSIADEPLFSKIKKSFNKVATLFFLLTTVSAGIAYSLLRSLRGLSNEEFGSHLMQYWTLLASYALAMVMFFFAIHFFFMSFLLEYRNKMKSVFVSLLSFMVAFLSGFIF